VSAETEAILDVSLSHQRVEDSVALGEVVAVFTTLFGGIAKP